MLCLSFPAAVVFGSKYLPDEMLGEVEYVGDGRWRDAVLVV